MKTVQGTNNKTVWIRVLYPRILEEDISKEASAMALKKTTFIRTALYDEVRKQSAPNIILIENKIKEIASKRHGNPSDWKALAFEVGEDFKKDATIFAQKCGMYSREKFLGYLLLNFLIKRGRI